MLAIVFHIAGSRYALGCQSIVEVISLVALRPVPHAPTWYLGLFAYRGHLTPVVDLCMLIGGYACPKRLSSRIALVRCSFGGQELVYGLLAEHMTEARRVEAGALSTAALGTSPFFGEMMLEGDELLQMIDENAVLDRVGSLLREQFEHRGLPGSEADRSRTQS
jgi:chemotaxis-related protein WspB